MTSPDILQPPVGGMEQDLAMAVSLDLGGLATAGAAEESHGLTDKPLPTTREEAHRELEELIPLDYKDLAQKVYNEARLAFGSNATPEQKALIIRTEQLKEIIWRGRL